MTLALNSKAKLFFFDHQGSDYYDPVKMEGKIALLEITPLLKGTNAEDLVVASAADATHLLVHLNPTSRIKARSGQWPESINADQIILCLTTADGFDPIKFPHRIDEIGGFRRVTFFSRVGKPIKDVEAFAEFCALDLIRAKSIAEGDINISSPSLREALSVTENRYLSALAILCQTYLILHISATPTLALSSDEIRAALEDMGFWNNSGQQKDIILPADLNKKVELLTPQWWVIALTSAEVSELDERPRMVFDRIRKEWERLGGNASKDKKPSEYNWRHIESLLKAIGLTSKKSEKAFREEKNVLEPLVVAGAYRAIKSVFVPFN